MEYWSGKPRAIYETDEYKILSEAEYRERVNLFYSEFCGKWKEITEERYYEMLDILPPMYWKAGGFFISEGIVLDIYSFFQEEAGHFYEACFRLKTPRTEIMKSLYAFINSRVEAGQ